MSPRNNREGRSPAAFLLPAGRPATTPPGAAAGAPARRPKPGRRSGSEFCRAQHLLPPPAATTTTAMEAAAVPSDAIAAAAAPARAFEPVLPDAAALWGMGSVVVLCVAAGLVWANSVVPVSRTKLAISKSRGEVKEYLDGLRDDAGAEVESAPLEGEAAGALNATALGTDAEARREPVKPNVGDGRDLERWLFSDWLNSGANAKAGRQKEPALPILKDAKWNSGDNPVLVTSALLGLCVILASLTERVGSLVGSG